MLDLNVDVIWVSDMRACNLVNHSIHTLASSPAVAINQSPLTSPGPGPLDKSIMDKSFAFAGLLALSPLLIVVAVLVKLTSKGPILWKKWKNEWNTIWLISTMGRLVWI